MVWATPAPFHFAAAWLRTGYLHSAPTLAALAEQCAIDGGQLAETVARFNDYAARGEDPEFQRGVSAYNWAQGDAASSSSNAGSAAPCALLCGAYFTGFAGLFSGLKTDEQARVLDAHQQPIAGLYAGNDMSSVMQGYYPSGGITGPAMTFGYLVGKTLAANITKTAS